MCYTIFVERGTLPIIIQTIILPYYRHFVNTFINLTKKFNVYWSILPIDVFYFPYFAVIKAAHFRRKSPFCANSTKFTAIFLQIRSGDFARYCVNCFGFGGNFTATVQHYIFPHTKILPQFSAITGGFSLPFSRHKE